MKLGFLQRRLECVLYLGEVVLEKGLVTLEHLRDGFKTGRRINLRGWDSVKTAYERGIDFRYFNGRRVQGIEAIDFIEGNENGLVRHCHSPCWARNPRAGGAGNSPNI